MKRAAILLVNYSIILALPLWGGWALMGGLLWSYWSDRKVKFTRPTAEQKIIEGLDWIWRA